MSVKPVKNTTTADLISSMTYQLNSILLGKDKCVKLSLACILAKGNLLIEDLPGMGKTTLAHGLAAVLALQFKRVQFTSDLLPGDVLGASIFNPKTSEFEFRAGPIFTQILLADEINRSSPKTQSALLEAMSENQVTVDGVSHQLDEHFFVIATQNSQHQTGTFPLPESQLDRFMMRISLGYPDSKSERELLKGVNPKQRLASLKPELSLQALKQLQDIVGNISVSDSLLDYFQRLLTYTRESGAASSTHLRAHETGRNLVCRLLLEKKKTKKTNTYTLPNYAMPIHLPLRTSSRTQNYCPPNTTSSTCTFYLTTTQEYNK